MATQVHMHFLGLQPLVNAQMVNDSSYIYKACT